MVVERRAADRRLEIAQSASELASDLWKPLRSEHQQGDDEDEQQMRWLKNVADHTEEVSQLQVWRRLSFAGRLGAGISPAPLRVLPRKFDRQDSRRFRPRRERPKRASGGVTMSARP